MIFEIKTRNKQFDLLKDVQKNLGVVFHPNTTVSSVETLIKEKANANTGTPKASSEVRQSHNQREGFEGKTEKATGKKKADGVEFTQN
tara:strand:- start:126 stop:389 length:264 start_codon:yes stop_codon:yes gene_type:complete